MRWISLRLVAALIPVSLLIAVAQPTRADVPMWELICEEGYGGMKLACAVRKPAIMIYADTSGRHDITLGFEHHGQRSSGQLEGLVRFRFQIDDGSWNSWRLGVQRREFFDAYVAEMMDASVISTRHSHFTSRVEFSETASVDQGFRDAYVEMNRLLAEASAE